MAQALKGAIVWWATLLTGLAQLGSPTSMAPKLGAARGVVVDQRGKPVAGATVFVAGSLSLRPFAITDDQGRFLLENVSGELGLLAFRKADGYPYNFFAFFQSPDQRFPLIHAVLGQVIENVVIQLGLKAATIKFDVKDENGRPLTALASFARPDLPEIGDYTEFVSQETVSLPPVPLRVTVRADGYEPWHYGGERWKTEKGLIKVKSGKTFRLPIRLRGLPTK